MKKIEPLIERAETDKYGNIYGTYNPTAFEMMEKINELVVAVNALIEKHSQSSKDNPIMRDNISDEYKRKLLNNELPL